MISLRVFAIVAIVGALLLGLSACFAAKSSKVGQGCLVDTDCVKGLHCCGDKCHECCADRDCDEDAGEGCSDDHKCVQVVEPPTEPEPESEEEPPAPAPEPEPESEEEPPPPAPEPEPECTQDSECCESHEGQAFYCSAEGKCLALGCNTPADCTEVCPAGNWDCSDDICLEADECASNSDCCDLHPGEVWECSEDDGKCYKVGCDTTADCEEICPTGQWTCDESFGDCVKAEPECSSDQDCPEGSGCNADGECEAQEQQTAVDTTLRGLHVPGALVWAGILVNGPLTNEQIAAIVCGNPQGSEQFHLLYHFGPTIEVGADGVFYVTDVPVSVEVQVIAQLELCPGSDLIAGVDGTDVIEVGPEHAGEIDVGEVKPLVNCPCD